MTRADADVIVVGAGPAGAAASILLAEHGFHVLVLDRARFPRPKVCGEYLSPEAGRILDRLGILKIVDAAAVPLKGMRITAPDGTTLVGTYRPVGEWRPYRHHAMAVQRLALDAILADRLRRAPVDFREEVRVADLVMDGDQVTGVEARDAENRPLTFRSRVVLGADGRTSVVAQRLDCRQPHRLQRMALMTYLAGLADCREFGEIFVDPPDYVILNPVAEDLVNMSLVVPLDHAAPHSDRLEVFFDARVRQMRHVVRRVQGGGRVAPVRAMGPLAYRVSPPREGGVLLIGDAGGFYDPFTGEGMFSALRSAEIAVDVVARALRTGDVSARALRPYQRLRDRAFRGKERLTRALQVVIRRRPLANVAARMLDRRPALLDSVMAAIGDFAPAGVVLRPLLGI